MRFNPIFPQLASLPFILLVLSSAIAQTPTPTPNNTNTISKGANITKPGCPRKCGNLTVPYPFGLGIGSGCAIDPTFEIYCNTSENPPTPLIGNIQVYDISDTHVWISNVLASQCYTPTGGVFSRFIAWTTFMASGPYTFSDLNKFTVLGCDDSAAISGNDRKTGKSFSNSCPMSCTSPDDVQVGNCIGGTSGCCQISIPKGLKSYNISEMTTVNNHKGVWSFNPCGYAFLGASDHFHFRGLDDLKGLNFLQGFQDTVPIILDWAIAAGNLTCDDATKRDDFACKENSHCVNADNGFGGYRCRCDDGYEGNPYITNGCQDIDECADPNMNNCVKICTNTAGSYNCSCPYGHNGDGKRNGRGCIAPISQFPLIKLSVGLGVGLLSMMVGVTWLYLFIKKRKLLKLREKFFQQNGGLILKQRINAAKGGGVEATKIFTAAELEKATNNYSADMELGRGGNGIVYKGILPDNRVIAIKKSKSIDGTKIEEFINEVVILTQINHRNVVKLLGCCLEDEAPLLVYEHVSNGTLFDHIHGQPGPAEWLSWENRLRVAIETAGALAYLHSSASIPIIHRDVKSTNILVDEHYTAKVSDFGASRLIPLDQTHLATLVIGTLGYLDPEYSRTGQLTDKSDVYSFGVVLCELLTGLRPISKKRTEEEGNLAEYMVILMNRNQLFKILDRRVLRECTLEQVQKVAELAKRCLHLTSEDRPTMKEVVMELEALKKLNRQAWGGADQLAQQTLDGQMNDDVEGGPSDLYTLLLSSLTLTSEYSGLHTTNSSNDSNMIFPTSYGRRS